MFFFAEYPNFLSTPSFHRQERMPFCLKTNSHPCAEHSHLLHAKLQGGLLRWNAGGWEHQQVSWNLFSSGLEFAVMSI